MLTIKYPPLKNFRIDFGFKKPEELSFNRMAKVEEVLKKDYSISPNINLIEYPFDTPKPVNLPIQIGPIKFLNEEKTRQIQFYSDGLIFIFTEYTSWIEIRDKIIEILLSICKILGIGGISQFRMEYIDEFYISENNFELKKFFNLNVNHPAIWNIDYRDYHTGIKIHTNNEDKFIIRLRGLPSKKEEHFFFRLENIFVKKEGFDLDSANLVENLDKIHDEMDEHFLNILTEDHKNNLGVVIK